MRYEGNECAYCLFVEGGMFTYGALVGACVKGVSWQVSGGYALAAGNGVGVACVLFCGLYEATKNCLAEGEEAGTRNGGRNNARVAVAHHDFPDPAELQIVEIQGRSSRQDPIARRVYSENPDVPSAGQGLIEIPAEMARALSNKIKPGEESRLVFLNEEHVKVVRDLGINVDSNEGGVIQVSEDELYLILDELNPQEVVASESISPRDRGGIEVKERHEKGAAKEKKEADKKGDEETERNGVRRVVADRFKAVTKSSKLAPR